VVVAHEARRAADVQLRVADAITAFAGSMPADHDFVEQEEELKTNTELTRAIHTLAVEIHSRVVTGPVG
jgi:hypothetical protein